MKPKTLAFYLPQYHPIPENDKWWGDGFTDWLSVVQSRPRFPEHYQPHLPRDLGFYDLRLDVIREKQIELAQKYGVDGFIYYHYWFSGKRILSTPLDMLLENKNLDFPFCLTWANESWTNTWGPTEGSRTGEASLINQEYSEVDFQKHIEWLYEKVFVDRRYIHHGNRPIFIVYRPSLISDIDNMMKTWKEYCEKIEKPFPYMLWVESFEDEKSDRYLQYGFSGSVEFQPRPDLRGKVLPGNDDYIYSYEEAIDMSILESLPERLRYPGVMPGWDNSARRKNKATIYHGSEPKLYCKWLKEALHKACNISREEQSYVFINAWNEWAEGCHLEPDLKWGTAFLEAHHEAVNSLDL